ncbi:hypothetical protein PspCFBP13509_10945 [Pseudomonas sp. CFBP13509]|uniref:hypothetical protein n=1 Tax=Pseudomonas sp. CFBP13509 TaxID=2184008 RepID=UPI0010BF9761|nr:hypothetical protein [Pseudomonas sp. CFBP13509]TKJ79961.1 hypothetical protein PspCFBP13509_10945 [Pseudomonas sp. CFBP13509]
MNNELVSFLLPRLEPLQMFFFLFITGATLLTGLMVALRANAHHWEKKWQGGKLGASGLRADHGSIHDLSEAVSTTAEKIAGIMPGMLLVVGLLGTFLGLGMALDHASTILQKSGNASVGAMGGAMQDMTAMMQGLGTKFKTSTWGIMAFILLKVWDLLLGYEGRRLAWCITQVKTQMSASEQQRENARAAHDAFLQNCISSAAKYMTGALGKQADTFNELMQQQANRRHGTDAEQRQLLQTGFDSVSTHISGLANGISALLQSESNSQQIAREGQAIVREAADTAQRTEQALGALADSNKQHLQTGFAGLDTRIASVTEGIGTLLQRHTESLQVHRDTQDVLSQIATSGNRTEQAMTAFTDNSRDNLQALQTAGETMGDAAGKVGQSAAELQVVVSALQGQMAEVMNGVKADLNGTLATMNKDFSDNLHGMGTQLESATTKLGDVMEAVKTDLGSNIKTMNHDFGTNLVNMTTSLGQATGNISKAIDSMSGTVSQAMEEVAANMQKTAIAQEKTTREFEMVSDNLNTNILAIQGVVEKLSKDILSGLKAVSESGQRMVSLDQRYGKVSEMLIKVPESLDALASVVTRPPVDLQPLLQSVNQLTGVANNINKSVTARKAVKAVKA